MSAIPQPILIGREQVTFSVPCDECVREKNEPGGSGWATTDAAELSDVMLEGELSLDEDDAWVECRRGHRHFAVREGSERAGILGFG
jgi:hypothetical protein